MELSGTPTKRINNSMAYSDKVVQRFNDVLNNPKAHGVGRFDPNDPNVATGMTGAPSCGDVMKLDLKINPDTDVIEDVKFKTYGCGSAIASSTMFVEMLKGITTDEAQQIKDNLKIRFFNEITEDKIQVIIIPDIESVNYGRGVGYDIIEHTPPQNVKEISATKIRAALIKKNETY